MKKISSFLTLSLLVTFFGLVGQGQAAFTDVKSSHTNYTAIDYVQNESIVSGYPDGSFKPDQTINRAEFTKIIINAQYGSGEINNCLEENLQGSWSYAFFPDVPRDAWFAKYICVAYQNGIIAGYPDGTFGPANNINFAEASKIIVNTFGYTVKTDPVWYKPFVQSLSDKKAIPPSIFELDAVLERGEMAEMIYRLLEEVTNLDSTKYENSVLVSPSADPNGDPLALDEVQYWGYQIQSIVEEGMVDKLVESNYDMLVLEPTRTDWSSNAKNFDSKGMVDRIKASKASDGIHRKLAIAYIDIGEAEDWRWYWKWNKNWPVGTEKPTSWPDYIISHDPDGWGGNYPVAYWDPQWKNITIYGKDLSSSPHGNYNSIIDEVIKSGFDGIYLDWVEGFENTEVMAQAKIDGVDPADEMIDFIQEMRDYAEERNPNFLIIQQNAASLQDGHPELFDVIDAIAQEAIWYDGDATDDWDDANGHDHINESSLVSYYLDHLDAYKKAEVPVFACEYALEFAEDAYDKSYEKDFVPLATRRSLGNLTTTPPDGLDDSAQKKTDNSVKTSDIWVPDQLMSWDWQLTKPINENVNVEVIDIDLFDHDAATVKRLHDAGKKVICYISAGSTEDWRPDKDAFPSSIIGKDYDGWPGEKWLDIRQIDKLAPIMRARMDLCASKGFDGLEPDNIQSHEENTGFAITAADQLAYNKWLANEAHERGLSIGLKNDSGQAEELVSYFDWALTEECYEDDWCDEMKPFADAGKAVFMTEYTERGTKIADFCPLAKSLGFNGLLKKLDLDDWGEACP